MKDTEQHQAPPKPIQPTSKTQVVKDTLVFQVKLFGDGMRDVFLSPVSIVAALAGLIFKPSSPDYYLRKLMAFGHKTDRWLNLFGTYGHHSNTSRTTSDTYVKKVEEMLIKSNQVQATNGEAKAPETTTENPTNTKPTSE